MPLVEARNLRKTYRSSDSELTFQRPTELVAVGDVSLAIQPGETLGLVGESGSGKSTLGRMLVRLLEPDAGNIFFSGHDISHARGSALRQLRRDMQIIFQDPFGSLDPRMTVEDIVSEPLVIHGEGDRRASRALAVDMMRAVGLDASGLSRYPHEFSGGQRQRIGIARALILHPKFVVADEPVSALDVSVGAQIVNLMRKLQEQFELTYLFISHSLPVVRYISTHIAVMSRGKIVETGTAEEVINSPQHEYTRALLEATPELDVAATC
jgi:peptide/nickel transport system ATP-binding protein